MKIFWKDSEWLAVCSELHRRDPITTFSSKTLAGMRIADVVSAMQAALPEDRWRSGLVMALIKPKLLEVFASMKADAALKHDEQIKTPPPVAPPANLIEDGMTMLFKGFAAEVAKHLSPHLETYVAGVFLRISEGMPIQHAVEEAKLTKIPKVVKRRIGVVGLLPIQSNEIEAKHPEIKFTFCETGPKGVRDAVANCEVVFCMTNKINHQTDHLLMKTMGDKYRRVAGGPSAVDRAITIWLASQV